MSRRDLCHDLRKEFQEDRLCGVSKAHDPKYNRPYGLMRPSGSHDYRGPEGDLLVTCPDQRELPTGNGPGRTLICPDQKVLLTARLKTIRVLNSDCDTFGVTLLVPSAFCLRA